MLHGRFVEKQIPGKLHRFYLTGISFQGKAVEKREGSAADMIGAEQPGANVLLPSNRVFLFNEGQKSVGEKIFEQYKRPAVVILRKPLSFNVLPPF